MLWNYRSEKLASFLFIQMRLVWNICELSLLQSNTINNRKRSAYPINFLRIITDV